MGCGAPFYVCRLAGPLLGVKLRGPWVVLVCGAHGGGGRAGVRGPRLDGSGGARWLTVLLSRFVH